MKPYIAAYKARAKSPTITQDQLVYWYRPTPKNTKCTGDPVPPPDGIQYLSDVVFVTTMLTSPANLIVKSGSRAPVTIKVAAGIVTSKVTMGVGTQAFVVQRNGATIISGNGGKAISSSCVYYNFNAYVGSLSAKAPTKRASTAAKPKTTAKKTTAKKTTARKTTTKKAAPKATAKSTPKPSGNTCRAGTGNGGYSGLCSFSCRYGYCPPGPCVCTSRGARITAPPGNGKDGRPRPGLDNSYSGLCSFACSHGYCPNTACVTS